MTYTKPAPKPYTDENFATIQNIINIWSSTCGPQWWLYVETTKEPLWDLTIELLAFDMFDLIRSCLRPARLIQGGHRPRRKRGRVKVAFPEPSDMICNRLADLDDGDTIKKRKVTTGVKTLWEIDGLAQRGLLYVMIAELASEFAYTWTSSIIEGLHDIGGCFGAAQCASSGGGITGGNVWQPPSGLAPVFQQGTCQANINGAVSCGPGVPADVVASGIAKPPAGFSYQIRIRTFNLGIWLTSGPTTYSADDPDAGALIPPNQWNFGPQSFIIEMRTNTGPLTPIEVVRASINIQQ